MVRKKSLIKMNGIKEMVELFVALVTDGRIHSAANGKCLIFLNNTAAVILMFHLDPSNTFQPK